MNTTSTSTQGGKGNGGNGGGKRPRRGKCSTCGKPHDPTFDCWPVCQACNLRHPINGCHLNSAQAAPAAGQNVNQGSTQPLPSNPAVLMTATQQQLQQQFQQMQQQIQQQMQQQFQQWNAMTGGMAPGTLGMPNLSIYGPGSVSHFYGGQ